MEAGQRLLTSTGVRGHCVDAALFGVGVGFPPPTSGAFVFAGFDCSGAEKSTYFDSTSRSENIRNLVWKM